MWPSGIHRKNSTSVCSLYRVSGSPASFSPRGAFHEHFSTKRVNSWPAVDVGSTFSPSGPAGVHGLATPETPSSRTVMTSHWDHLSAWLRNDSLGVQLIFYWLTILLVPIFDCFLFVWASVICPWGCKDPKGGHHREMLNFLTFWSFLAKRATRSQLEKGRSQWWVGPSPAHCRPFCSWRDKWVANRLLVPDFPGVTQTCSQTQRSDRTILNFFFFWGRHCLGIFLPERILCLEVTRKDELLNNSSVMVQWAEKKQCSCFLQTFVKTSAISCR